MAEIIFLQIISSNSFDCLPPHEHPLGTAGIDDLVFHPPLNELLQQILFRE